jgi:3-deoxy-D-manno-octulosonic-acid transferase
MRYLLNIIYLVALFLFSPLLIYRMLTMRKYRRGLWRKLSGRTDLVLAPGARRLWFHAVSVGEVHLLQPVLSRLRQRHPDWQVVVSTTTDTGYDEARRRFSDVPVIFWPFDFSWAVSRALREVQADVVVLGEGEMWPNFLMAARRQGVTVAIINGRMSPRSFRRYRMLRVLARRLLQKIHFFGMQTEDYATNIRSLGAPAERVQVTGNIKYDGVEANRNNLRTEGLRQLFNVQQGDLIWIAGSTQAPEESLALDIFRRQLPHCPRLRLFIVPRQKERFDEVAALLDSSSLAYVRRSRIDRPIDTRPAIVLVDSIGELGSLWGLADIAFVGGSLDGRRGGQNMIEPAAYGAAVVFGPHTWNFKADVTRLLEAGAAVQVQDGPALESVIGRLSIDAIQRAELGRAARQLVQRHQGAADRTLMFLEQLVAQNRALAA